MFILRRQIRCFLKKSEKVKTKIEISYRLNFRGFLSEFYHTKETQNNIVITNFVKMTCRTIILDCSHQKFSVVWKAGPKAFEVPCSLLY